MNFGGPCYRCNELNDTIGEHQRYIEKLKAEKQVAVVERDVLQNNLAAFEASIRHEFKEREDKLFEDRKVLVEALKFYCNEVNLVGSIAGPSGPWDYSAIDIDRGATARTALTKLNKPTPTGELPLGDLT